MLRIKNSLELWASEGLIGKDMGLHKLIPGSIPISTKLEIRQHDVKLLLDITGIKYDQVKYVVCRHSCKLTITKATMWLLSNKV